MGTLQREMIFFSLSLKETNDSFCFKVFGPKNPNTPDPTLYFTTRTEPNFCGKAEADTHS